jgi:hypothetical protein
MRWKRLPNSTDIVLMSHLMDLRLPRTNGVDAVISIRGEAPQARVIILSTSDMIPTAKFSAQCVLALLPHFQERTERRNAGSDSVGSRGQAARAVRGRRPPCRAPRGRRSHCPGARCFRPHSATAIATSKSRIALESRKLPLISTSRIWSTNWAPTTALTRSRSLSGVGWWTWSDHIIPKKTTGRWLKTSTGESGAWRRNIIGHHVATVLATVTDCMVAGDNSPGDGSHQAFHPVRPYRLADAGRCLQ